MTSIRAILLAVFAIFGASPLAAQSIYLPSYPMPNATAAPWLEGWAGFGVSNNWYGGWAGFNYAFNHNAWSSGLLLRAEGGGGHYDYTQSQIFNSNPNPVGFVNATYGVGSVLLGWRAVLPGFIGITTTLDGFIGAEYQRQNNPDPFADVTGSEWGVKVIGDIYTRLSQYQDFFGLASFSSAFDTWLLIARPGFLLTPPGGIEWWVGPDMQVFGNGHGWLHDLSGCNGAAQSSGNIGSCKYDEGRIGGFIHIVIPNQPLWGDWLISGGYRKPLIGTSPDGYYAQIGWNFRFQ